MEAKITFKDGSSINAEVNGSCYIVDENPGFPADLSVVNVKDEDGEKVFKNAQVIECASVDGRYWFSFLETSEEELEKEKIDAQIMYTALMTDTLLEEE